MKSNLSHCLAAFAVFLTIVPARAQTFNSGSDGSYGEMHITADTILDMPPDGVFKCTSITIDANATLRFRRNPLNTPVYLLARDGITIEGTIDVSGGNYNGGVAGAGGPGGFDGGYGGYGVDLHSAGGDGSGPGGGRNSHNFFPGEYGGVYAEAVVGNTNVYGNALLTPLVGGSGGAGFDGNPGPGGGGGGGAILLAANVSIVLNGQLNATGGSGVGGGSGGGIRLVSPVVTGAGFCLANGGGVSYAGSRGRIRIDCENRELFRTLRLDGKVSRGSQMFVFPATNKRLDIVEVAGQTIASPASAPVIITLPPGTSTSQTVKIAASGFTGNVPVRVVVTPENASASVYDGIIDRSSAHPDTVDLQVNLSPGIPCRIHAWTR
jgi:hypothetical protein